MGDEEREEDTGKGLEVYQLAEIIENSERVMAWENEKNEEYIQLKRISPGDAHRLEELGVEFLDKYSGRISESQNLPFSFFLDSVSSPRIELTELKVSSMVRFRDKNQAKGRALLFSLKSKERLFGLAKFGEKYDGVHHRDLEPGFFALVIFLKRA